VKTTAGKGAQVGLDAGGTARGRAGPARVWERSQERRSASQKTRQGL